jgi:hypothetical protein
MNEENRCTICRTDLSESFPIMVAACALKFFMEVETKFHWRASVPMHSPMPRLVPETPRRLEVDLCIWVLFCASQT